MFYNAQQQLGTSNKKKKKTKKNPTKRKKKRKKKTKKSRKFKAEMLSLTGDPVTSWFLERLRESPNYITPRGMKFDGFKMH